ncbi:MAG TPA: hypothetical protein VEA81_14430 [Burkholderiaceae bacterium]|nr:hypothetical protein [Burkholderiaceae bacterium]
MTRARPAAVVAGVRRAASVVGLGVIAGCGGGSDGVASLPAPTVVPVAAVLTRAFQGPVDLTLQAPGAGLSARLQRTPLENQVFQGLSRRVSEQSLTVAGAGGTVRESCHLLHSLEPLGLVACWGGPGASAPVTVYTMTGTLPATGRVGDAGPLFTAIRYRDPSFTTGTFDTAVGTYAVLQGPGGTADVCIVRVFTRTDPAGVAGTEQECHRVDPSGTLVGVRLTTTSGGRTVTFQ